MPFCVLVRPICFDNPRTASRRLGSLRFVVLNFILDIPCHAMLAKPSWSSFFDRPSSNMRFMSDLLANVIRSSVHLCFTDSKVPQSSSRTLRPFHVPGLKIACTADQTHQSESSNLIVLFFRYNYFNIYTYTLFIIVLITITHVQN